jgi:hypothetical protein
VGARPCVDFVRPLTRADEVAVVRCARDVGARTRESVAAPDGTLVATAAATLEGA